jgi:hypothetical protein
LPFFVFDLFIVIGCSPQGQVITKQLHDQSRVLIRFFVQSIKLGDGIIESRLGDLACAIRRVQNLIVKDREVKSKTKADGMCWGKVGRGDSTGSLVSIKGRSGGFLSGITTLELGKVAVLQECKSILEK